MKTMKKLKLINLSQTIKFAGIKFKLNTKFSPLDVRDTYKIDAVTNYCYLNKIDTRLLSFDCDFSHIFLQNCNPDDLKTCLEFIEAITIFVKSKEIKFTLDLTKGNDIFLKIKCGYFKKSYLIPDSIKILDDTKLDKDWVKHTLMFLMDTLADFDYIVFPSNDNLEEPETAEICEQTLQTIINEFNKKMQENK